MFCSWHFFWSFLAAKIMSAVPLPAQKPLTLRYVSVFKLLYEQVEEDGWGGGWMDEWMDGSSLFIFTLLKEDSGESFANYRHELYTSVIVTGLAFSFPFVEVYNRGILEVPSKA